MHRMPCFLAALLCAVGSVAADEGKKLTHAEMKEITSKTFFYSGYSNEFGIRFLIASFANGTRETLWTNGVTSKIVKGKWRIDGDQICSQNEGSIAESCADWRRNGDRIEFWRLNQKGGYFYILQ